MVEPIIDTRMAVRVTILYCYYPGLNNLEYNLPNDDIENQRLGKSTLSYEHS